VYGIRRTLRVVFRVISLLRWRSLKRIPEGIRKLMKE